MPAPFPHRYDVRFEARGPEGWLTAGATRSPIEAGAPPEFDGSADVWSPEHLLLSSLALCHFTTFQAFAGKARIEVAGFETSARAVLAKTPEGLAFTELVLDVAVDVKPEDRERASVALTSRASRGWSGSRCSRGSRDRAAIRRRPGRRRACTRRRRPGPGSGSLRSSSRREPAGRPAERAWGRCSRDRHAIGPRSPGRRPGKPGRGVTRSLPLRAENARNSAVTWTHTTWSPRSFSSVSQQPVRKKPVRGESEHVSRGWPSRLR